MFEKIKIMYYERYTSKEIKRITKIKSGVLGKYVEKIRLQHRVSVCGRYWYIDIAISPVKGKYDFCPQEFTSGVRLSKEKNVNKKNISCVIEGLITEMIKNIKKEIKNNK